ncbi:hypothetical protein G0U57_004924 [Chelydra serpentina]|uniref:VWFD domain-containing protein n=1 Tax=Chelydra serpentina TaxID=8475 RepID=A0A8T1RZ52_CHESE|nr:hypothetical protein G0U57_004924 [Chelydra serpentina]
MLCLCASLRAAWQFGSGSGMQVLFSSSGEVTVRVSENLANKLCAPCGNFNGDISNDLRLPIGGIAGNITEVINAWKARDFSGCDV